MDSLVVATEQLARIPMGKETCDATLSVPPECRGVIVFAHGSGSGRHSPRNRAVAEVLQRARFATLLADLLTPDEERMDEVTRELRFDIPFLATRVACVIDWLATTTLGRMPIGLYGASTGAAAALVAAAELPGHVKAIVSRGGRPDLAEDALERVRAPTLLVVGGRDHEVLRLNQEALARLHVQKDLVVVPGATHLFEERGALDEVSAHTRAWFARFLGT